MPIRLLSILLVKSKRYLGELEFISLPITGSPLSLKLVVSKHPNNSSMFLFVFRQFAILLEQMFGVCQGGSSRWSGMGRCMEFGIGDETQSKQIGPFSLLTRLSV